MRQIKLKVLDAETKELVGYERIGYEGQWYFQRHHRTKWLLGYLTDGQEYRKLIRLQFTGFLDKNGKEIYEGDIISKAGAIIVWYPTLGCWCFQFKDSKEPPTPLYYGDNLKKSEVLGNIYNNPEFLNY